MFSEKGIHSRQIFCRDTRFCVSNALQVVMLCQTHAMRPYTIGFIMIK